jgi:poly-D-alanine transfer protein DltD
MSPIDTIREGILSKEWADVVAGFEMLTGEQLEYEPTGDTEEFLEEVRTAVKKKAAKKKRTRKKATRKKATRKKAAKKKATRKKAARKPVIEDSRKGFSIGDEFQSDYGAGIRFQGNNFNSDIGFEEELTEDEARKLGQIQDSIIKNPEYVPMQVTCEKCRRDVEIHPSLYSTTSRFICNKCNAARSG